MQGADIWQVPGHELADMALAADIEHVLATHYPGYIWAIHVDSEEMGGIVQIWNANLLEATGKRWGVKLRLSKVYADPSRKLAVQGAGLLLEFAGLPQSYLPGTVLDTTEFWKNYALYEQRMTDGWRPAD